MEKFNKKILGVKHSVVGRFLPLLYKLDGEFGEENVQPGYFDQIKGSGSGIRVRPKYFDHRRLLYRLQAKNGNAVQYFFLKLDEGYKSRIEEFLRKNRYL